VTFVARKTAPLFVVLAISAPAFAQPCAALRVRNPDGNYIIPGVKGGIRYAGHLALDAYVQRSADRRPSVVVIHGGAWSSGSRVAHVGQLLEVLTLAGYNWFAVDYRLGGLKRFEESLADIRGSLAWIRCRSRELNIDPERLILLGEDSGAQLSALLATERTPGVIGAALVGGFYDLTATPGMATGDDAALLTRASPSAHVVAKMPPLLVVHGSADGESPIEHAQRYCRAVAQAEGRCRLLEVDGASHRSENWWPTQWGYKREIVMWLSTLAPIPRGGCIHPTGAQAGSGGHSRAWRWLGGWRQGDVCHAALRTTRSRTAGVVFNRLSTHACIDAPGAARRSATGDPVRPSRTCSLQYRSGADRPHRRVRERAHGDADRG
jgi:acetyl esterase/lipase